jgi:hypothetical protein
MFQRNVGRVFASRSVLMFLYTLLGRGFDSRRGNSIFFLIYLILPDALGLGVYSASNRNEYQKQKKKSF